MLAEINVMRMSSPAPEGVSRPTDYGLLQDYEILCGDKSSVALRNRHFITITTNYSRTDDHPPGVHMQNGIALCYLLACYFGLGTKPQLKTQFPYVKIYIKHLSNITGRFRFNNIFKGNLCNMNHYRKLVKINSSALWVVAKGKQ